MRPKARHHNISYLCFAIKLRLRSTVGFEVSVYVGRIKIKKININSNRSDPTCTTTHPYRVTRVWAHMLSGVYRYNLCVYDVCLSTCVCVCVIFFIFFYETANHLPITVNLTLSSHLCEYSTPSSNKMNKCKKKKQWYRWR